MLVGGVVAEKPARQVAPGDPIVVVERWARGSSPGAEPSSRARSSAFGIVVEERVALDAGSATGGFTDCLLQRGARRVVAVDVGYGQLHERLRPDARVDSLERTNVRDLDPGSVAARSSAEELPERPQRGSLLHLAATVGARAARSGR